VFQGISDVGDTSAAAVFAATVDIGGGVLAGVLADNGGPVETIALRRDLTNPALDRSTNTAPATDARGEARVDRPGIANSNGSAADLGAFELESLAPSITSNGGGGAALVSIAENGKAVVTVAATDPDGQTPVFLIDGGSDAALFQIDAATGALFFEAAPDFEAPADVDGNNVYDVIVRASDGALSDTQSLSVTVTDVAGVKIVGTAADNMIDIAPTVAGQPLPGNEGDRISGKAGDDTITAGAGDDVVGGGLGDDKLDGGAGNDVLFAGKGDNRLTGGEGDDVFVIVRKHAFTKIVDYEDGEVIQFAKKAFPGIGPKGVLKAEFFHVGAEAETQHQRILYDDESGKILYLRHGSETQNPRVLLKIGEGLDHLDHSDFLVI
jgi:Ca2+-binding RTX toxin-like protein